MLNASGWFTDVFTKTEEQKIKILIARYLRRVKLCLSAQECVEISNLHEPIIKFAF